MMIGLVECGEGGVLSWGGGEGLWRILLYLLPMTRSPNSRLSIGIICRYSI